MNACSRALFALLIVVLWSNVSWGQFRFVPRAPVVPISPPRFAPGHVPHVPHVPGLGHPDARPSSFPRPEDRKATEEKAGQPQEPAAGFDPWYVALAVLAVAALAVVCLRARYLWSRSHRITRIRIRATPPGDAPEHIRRAWIGLELPLQPGVSEPQPVDSVGVLSRQPTAARLGYVVAGPAALRVLRSQAPGAAAWWLENVPQVTHVGYHLVFPADCCAKVTQAP